MKLNQWTEITDRLHDRAVAVQEHPRYVQAQAWLQPRYEWAQAIVKLIRTKAKLLPRIARNLSIFKVASLVLAIILNFFIYHTYWQSALYPVQTANINLISHSLPYTLSSLLLQGNYDDVERIIDSNFDFFGLVVTDCQRESNYCPDEAVIYSSRNLKKVPTSRELATTTYDLLRDPPPTLPDQAFMSPSSEYRRKLGRDAAGEIIGRVYYTRNTPSSFWNEYLSWVVMKFSKADASQHPSHFLFSTVNLVALIFAVLVWLSYELVRWLWSRSQTKELAKDKLKQEILETQYKLLESENRLLRIDTFTKVFGRVIDTDFTASVSNQAQELELYLKGILQRFQTDALNIEHDLRKAPLLATAGPSLDAEVSLVEQMRAHPEQVAQAVQTFIQHVGDSIRVINHTLNDLRSLTSIEGEAMAVSREVEGLLANLHPSLQRWQIMYCPPEHELTIVCNPWHYRSIIRNALYNASASIRDRHLQDPEAEPGAIHIRVYEHNSHVVTEITDNGLGIKPELLDRLYASEERLNTSAGPVKGNGSIIVYAFLRLYRGRAEKQNRQPYGATVRFIFPKHSVAIPSVAIPTDAPVAAEVEV